MTVIRLITFNVLLLAFQIREEFEAHQQTAPPKGTKGSSLQAYEEKSEFLTFEIMRYETYILTLRTKNALDA